MSTDVEVFRRKFCPTRSEWEADIDGQNPKTDMERFCQERARYLVRELRDAASGSTIYVTCEREFDSLQQAGIRPDVAIVIDAPKATLPTVIDGYGDWLRNDAAKRER